MPDFALESILPSPTNPRKHFNPEKLQQLADNVKRVGILQPVLVRPAPGFALVPGRDGGKPGWVWERDEGAGCGSLMNFHEDKAKALKDPPYELVAGERRYRASKLAGLETIPATVKDLTDIEVAEIQAIENDQREDVLPSERAAGYQNLIRLGQSVEQIATRVGKSTSTIRNALLVSAERLEEEFLDAIDSGKVPASTAQLVARVPGDQTRKTVALCVLQACRWPEGLNARGKVADEPLSSRETKNLIQQHFCRELKGAPFSRKDAKLPGGSCDVCPKRAGNAGDEYADVREDTCLDPGCFQAKAAQHAKNAEAAAATKGFTLLTKEEHKEVFGSDGKYFQSRVFLNLDREVYSEVVDSQSELWGKKLRVILKPYLDQITKYLAHNSNLERFELVKKSDVKKVLPKAKKSKNPIGGSQSRPGQDDPELRDAVRLAIMEQVATKAASEMQWLTQQNYPKLLMKLMRTLIFFEVECGRIDLVCQRRGVAVVNNDEDKAIKSIVDAPDFTFGEMFGLLCELRAADQFPDPSTDIVKAIGIDRKAVEKEVKAKLKEAKKAKTKKAGATA